MLQAFVGKCRCEELGMNGLRIQVKTTSTQDKFKTDNWQDHKQNRPHIKKAYIVAYLDYKVHRQDVSGAQVI